MSEKATPMEYAPCGCRWGQSGDAFVFEPCAMDCDLYAYVRAESGRQNKPLTTLVLLDDDDDSDK